jgi:hypothetical protein
VDREPETEIVSDAPIGRSKRREAKKATGACAEKSAVTVFESERAHPVVVEAAASEPVERRLSDQAQLEQGGCDAEEIRELVVERIVPNPRMVLASYEKDGQKRVVVGVNRNFKVRMRLKAQRGSDENAPWRLIGRRPRLPGRW